MDLKTDKHLNCQVFNMSLEIINHTTSHHLRKMSSIVVFKNFGKTLGRRSQRLGNEIAQISDAWEFKG